MTTENKRIKSLQGLRAIAFMAIFSEHAGLTHLGCWGVSCFIILSGFLMYYKHGEESIEYKRAGEGIGLAYNRIKGLLWLHFATFVISIIVYWDKQRVDTIRHIVIYIIKALSNILLLQSWFPKSEFYFSFNAVSWYLSTALFFYLVFPFLKRCLRIDSNKSIGIYMGLTLVFQMLVSTILLVNESQLKRIPMFISDDLTKYITYIFPLYRLGDFFIGCLLGKLFVKHQNNINMNEKWISVIEIIMYIMIILLQCIYIGRIYAWVLNEDAFRYTLLNTINVGAMIYVISSNKGYISKYVLSSKVFNCLGDLSGFAFLLHQLVIVVVTKIAGIRMNVYIIAIISFIITILLAIGCCSFITVFRNGKIKEFFEKY